MHLTQETVDLLTLIILFCLGNGDVPFTSRRGAIVGTKNFIEIMRKIGLIDHSRSESIESKNKVYFFPITLVIRLRKKIARTQILLMIFQTLKAIIR